MPQTFGRRPKPRMLVIESDDTQLSDELVAALTAVAPTTEFVTLDSFASDVNELEWDVIVLRQCDANVGPEVNVVQFGGSQTGVLTIPGNSFNGFATAAAPSTHFDAPDNFPPQISTLVPALAANLAAVGRSQSMAIPPGLVGYGGVIIPFLTRADGEAVAGFYRRAEGGPREWWWPSGLHARP